MTCGIYCIENIENGMQYIGKGTILEKRISENHQGCRCIEGAFKKYGNENFIQYPIEYCEPWDLDYWEQYYIKEWDTKVPNGYNLTDGGEGSLGFNHTKESKELMKKIWAGKRKGKDNPNYGNHALAGKNHFNYGKHLCEVIKEKIKISNTGKKQSDETKEKKRKAGLGKKSSVTSKYIGVRLLHKKYWQVRFKHRGIEICAGNHKTELDAALAYDNYVIEHELDRPLNFPKKTGE
jgi:group I intron endonuclease